MKIAIFGASGATGRLLVEGSLAAGHSVTALVRTPTKFAYADRVRVVEGDVFNQAAIAATLEGAEGVFSALGAKSPFVKDDALERGIPLIVRGMEAAGIGRIVVLGSAGALDSALDRQPAWRRWLVEKIVYTTLLKWPVEAQRAQFKALEASGLDWTMAMPPMLTNGPARGRIQVDGRALPRHGSRISRADVADFMFRELEAREWVGKGVYVCR